MGFWGGLTIGAGTIGALAFFLFVVRPAVRKAREDALEVAEAFARLFSWRR